MSKSNRQVNPNKRKQLWSLLGAGMMALSALLASPVGAAGLWGSEGEALDAPASKLTPDDILRESELGESESQNPFGTTDVDVTLNSFSEELLRDFMGVQVLEQTSVFLGMYTSSAFQITASEIGEVDSWLSANGLDTKVSIAGTFMDIEFPNPDWNIPHDLDAAWDQGAVPFINLAVGTAGPGSRSALEVANGDIDEAIRTWARIFADWSKGGTKRAFIAPLQEMNASWVTYGLDPENFKLAYSHIQEIFRQEGIPDSAVLWVFAPNGWSEPEHDFELYYPGDEIVDVIGFSAFNFGACVAGGAGWDTFEVAIQPYLDRMNAMAPSKPIFLTQTGTVEQGGDRSEWLLDSFDKLASSPMFQGILYFNVAKVEQGAPSCNPVDWRVYNPDTDVGESGFIQALRAFESTGEVEVPQMSYQVLIPLVGNSN